MNGARKNDLKKTAKEVKGKECVKPQKFAAGGAAKVRLGVIKKQDKK